MRRRVVALGWSAGRWVTGGMASLGLLVVGCGSPSGSEAGCDSCPRGSSAGEGGDAGACSGCGGDQGGSGGAKPLPEGCADAVLTSEMLPEGDWNDRVRLVAGGLALTESGLHVAWTVWSTEIANGHPWFGLTTLDPETLEIVEQLAFDVLPPNANGINSEIASISFRDDGGYAVGYRWSEQDPGQPGHYEKRIAFGRLGSSEISEGIAPWGNTQEDPGLSTVGC